MWAEKGLPAFISEHTICPGANSNVKREMRNASPTTAKATLTCKVSRVTDPLDFQFPESLG